jgi:2-oxoisovalerate dehydrogenase E1 component
VPPELYPTEDDLYVDVQSDGSEFAGTRFAERSDFSEMEERKLIDVIPEVIRRRVDQDERIVIMGEEVGNMRGGVFMATKGIFKTYPERVVNTPISEGGFSGMALGLALSGKRPIVELMYPDFTLVAADQIFNQIGKFRYMYGGQHEIPLVLRTKVGIGTGYGAQHSMEPAPLYALYPGWRIVAPATPFDYVGLFNAAMQSEDPVLVIEHHMLYDATGPAPADRDYFIELGTADVKRAGDHVTLVAYSYMTTKALAAAEELAESGVSCEVIDLRTVDYAHIDYDAIGASVRKTGRVILLEEGLICGGIGGHLAWEIQRRFFDYLDAEIARVAAAAVPIPVSRVQEERALPQVQDIVQAARDIVA